MKSILGVVITKWDSISGKKQWRTLNIVGPWDDYSPSCKCSSIHSWTVLPLKQPCCCWARLHYLIYSSLFAFFLFSFVFFFFSFKDRVLGSLQWPETWYVVAPGWPWTADDPASTSFFFPHETGFVFPWLSWTWLCRLGWSWTQETHLPLPPARIKGMCHLPNSPTPPQVPKLI